MPDQHPSAIWRLRPGADRRFRAGHPWVYSNELAASPKGIAPGAAVELRDAKDQFLARGYGNPSSLISFRALSRDPEIADPASEAFLFQALKRAERLREQVGMSTYSHRLVFGEADRLPGLVIDRYLLAEPSGTQVFVIQTHTAGAQAMLPHVLSALEKLGGVHPTAIVLRNDIGVRKLEGLAEEEPRVLKALPGLKLEEARILIMPATQLAAAKPLEFAVDLLGGQKTGFFLDQFGNIRLAAQLLQPLEPARGKTLRILDLCSYVGQWGAQLARTYREAGLDTEITVVDASEKALAFARRNIEAQGARCDMLRADVLRDLGGVPDASFDLVISDPPALIKSRKDIGPGTHAYLQLNTQVFRLARRGGAVVSCSCSALLEESEFASLLTKAASRNRVDVRWVGRGAPAADHPMLTEFPEGRYLKAWIGLVSL
jgi:23S rRNA (cytosine1962-C5)-methyltransferase